jgi:hypothetical protein
MLVPSNVLRVRVGHPMNERSDRLAQDVFSDESGTALYLGGSQSTFLADGMNALMQVAEEHQGTLAGAKTAARIARGVGLPFHDVAGGVETRGDAPQAMKLCDIAVGTFKRLQSPELNIPLERIVRTRADMLLRAGDVEAARDELRGLARTLSAGNVKPAVIAKIENDASGLTAR